MSIESDLQTVLAHTQTGIEATGKCITRLDKLREEFLPVEEESDRIEQASRAANERTQLNQIKAHLQAGTVTLQPLDQATVDELNDLGNRLNEKIRQNLIIDGSLDFVKSVLDEVNSLRGVVSDQTS